MSSGFIDKWHFYGYLRQQIEKMFGEDVYKKYGREIVWRIENMCSEEFDIVRYPEDEEIAEVLETIKQGGK